jgi:pilus assembly protein Flp/PilA
MMNFLKKLYAGEEGATMVEYALMVALIGAALIGVVTTLSSAIGGKFTSVGTAVSGAGTTP